MNILSIENDHILMIICQTAVIYVLRIVLQEEIKISCFMYGGFEIGLNYRGE